jgi:S-adenosylmethionine:tRNA ribosyltransferase-isomerase
VKKLEAYRFLLPEESIAKFPLQPAHESRVLRVPRRGPLGHHHCMDLPELLPKNSLIVANDTQVVKARLRGQRESGGKVEVLLAHPVSEKYWLALFKGKAREGEMLDLASEKIKVAEVCGGGFVLLDFGGLDVFALMEERGLLPLPPYLNREASEKDDILYQTSFAAAKGAVAAPTAGLHFTEELRSRLKEAGHEFVTVTLHVGPGTFLPVRSENILEHRVPAEKAEVTEEVFEKIQIQKSRFRPLVAVGTTSARTLETLARRHPKKSFKGEVNLTISPPQKFRMVDRLLTNFHLPESSLLLLASAFSGRKRLLAAYEEAVKKGYRFYSYGDLTLLE